MHALGAAPLGVSNGTPPGPFDGPQWPHLAPWGAYAAVAVLMGLVVVAASVANGLVLVVSAQYKKLRSPLNYILVNLAVADLLVTFFGSTVSFANNVRGFFVLGRVVCELEGFLVSLTGVVGLWSLAILAFERYLVICKPVGDFRFQQRHAVTGCVFTWVWALAWTVPPLWGWSSYVPEGGRTAEAAGDHSAGGEGGDPDGRHHGAGLPGVLAALCHFCPGGGHQPRPPHPALPGLSAFLLLQDRHRLQPRHLCLHEQAVSRLPPEHHQLWAPTTGLTGDDTSCDQPAPASPFSFRGEWE
ncbi:pinopsin-like isoform X5 [Hemicordylus capensis]|uniref:pinopsin-like isoform X5 n=1 Tax=Hemicordylus capensis TaxID=884348 RepID=UPI00230421CE|nr:pinopsin-like isoform X5 [Hemicordylus capensis]